MPQKSKINVKTPSNQVGGYIDFSPIQKLLALRGVEGDEIDAFLSPDFNTQIHNPFLLKDMKKVVDRIILAINNSEQILVYSDYDADGLPGAAIMHDFFTTISYPNVHYIAPDRHEKGFGLHASIVNPYIDLGVTLVITIDCGIADVNASADIIEYAKNKGVDLDLVITDHHLPAEKLPEVFAIINPKQASCEYPEKMLCGAAVIYKLVCALVETIRTEKHSLADKFADGYEKWLLDLVGISTLSDMVPLLGENRALAYFGLIVLRKTRRPGINLLCRTNAIDKTKIVEEDITFTISPRINVASRLASPKLAFDLLTTSDFLEAERLAKDLNNINARRKTMVATTMKQAHHIVKEKIENNNKELKNVLVVGNPDWKPPILGLVATQLIKIHKRPTFVWGKGDDGILKGSVRSIGDFDITEIMNGAREGLFVNKGGHALSGGFSITTNQVIDLEDELNKSFDSKYGVSVNDINGTELVHTVDLEVDIADLNLDFYKEIIRLAPFGVANEKPVFAIRGVEMLLPKMFGKQKEHLEIDCGPLKAIQFFTEYTEEDLKQVQSIKKPILIGNLELNQFRGANELRIKLIDVL